MDAATNNKYKTNKDKTKTNRGTSDYSNYAFWQLVLDFLANSVNVESLKYSNYLRAD
jgi:hypothetical protein